MNSTPPQNPRGTAESRFQRTLVQVLIVQAVALILLGALQALYSG